MIHKKIKLHSSKSLSHLCYGAYTLSLLYYTIYMFVLANHCLKYKVNLLTNYSS